MSMPNLVYDTGTKFRGQRIYLERDGGPDSIRNDAEGEREARACGAFLREMLAVYIKTVLD